MWTQVTIAALSLLPAQDVSLAPEALVQAALDYAEAYHERDPARIARSVSRDLDMLGYRRGERGAWAARSMTYADLDQVIEHLRHAEAEPPPKPREVEVLDLLDATALVKVSGPAAVEYLQMHREGEAWLVRHVLWQSEPWELPPEEAATDRAGIERALADYVGALYDVKPELVERGVDPALVKYGFWRDDPSQPYRGMALDFAGLREMASTWNASGWLAADAPRRIEVLDAMDKVAAAKLTAWWGVDTMLLVRQDDGSWKIRHVLWQGPVRTPDPAPREVGFPSADGGVVSADLYGEGEHAVVLAHGARFDKASWAREARFLAGHGLRVLAIDFRGYGASRAPAPSDDPYAGLEQDLLGAVAWLREQGARRVSLVGGSMGGTAASNALALDGGVAIDDVVLLAHWPSAEPASLKARKLFVVAREDAYGAGTPRLPAIRAQFDAAPEPKQWLELDGAEHAQFLFDGSQGDALRAALLAFLRAGEDAPAVR